MTSLPFGLRQDRLHQRQRNMEAKSLESLNRGRLNAPRLPCLTF